MDRTIEIPCINSGVMDLYKARPGLLGVWDRLRYVIRGELTRGMMKPTTIVNSFVFRINNLPQGSNCEIVNITTSMEPVEVKHGLPPIPIEKKKHEAN